MNYKYILYAICVFILAQIITWVQINGSIIWPWIRQYKNILLILGVPVTWLFMEATKLAVMGFNGEFWPSRFLSFVTGIFIFTICTYFFKSEAITLKTALCLLLATGILIIQLFWK